MTGFTARVSQLIDCAANEAFDAFADPERITRFWLTSASGPLSEGAKVTWQFMVPGAFDTLTVDRIERGRLIELTWSNGSKTRVEFSEHAPGQTKVTVAAQVSADGDLIEQVMNTTEGFAIVLCDLKTFLESGRSANLVRAKADLIAASMTQSGGDA